MRSFLYCAAVVFAMRDGTSETSNSTPNNVPEPGATTGGNENKDGQSKPKVKPNDKDPNNEDVNPNNEDVNPNKVPEVKTGNLPQQLTGLELKALSKLTDEDFAKIRKVDTDHLKAAKESYLDLAEDTFKNISNLLALDEVTKTVGALKKLELAMVKALQKLTQTGYERLQKFDNDYKLASIKNKKYAPGYLNGTAWLDANGWGNFLPEDFTAIQKLERKTLEAISYEFLMSVTEASLEYAHKLLEGSSFEKANFVLNGFKFQRKQKKATAEDPTDDVLVEGEPAAVEVLRSLDVAVWKDLSVLNVKSYAALKTQGEKEVETVKGELKQANADKTKALGEKDAEHSEEMKKMKETQKQFKLVNLVFAVLLVAALVACVVLAVKACKQGKEEVVESEV